jgi:CHAT domain-containing protein
LHEMPWAGLPSLAARSVALAPSAQMWLGADRRAARSSEGVAMLSGPEVEGAVLDRESILHHYPGATIVEGDAATASAARSLLGGADLVHVAAHGRFRSDRPLLSTLRLHEGDATLYDAVPDRVGARLVVLSSCEGGAQGTADGSEVLGLSAVMLARGAATVVAPLTVVRDLECAEFVADVHARLATGEPVGEALAGVRSTWLRDDDLSRWAVASSFLCFGSAATNVHVVSATT